MTAPLASAGDWDDWIRSVYGDRADLARPVGVLHVTAVWRAPEGGLVTLKILPETPKSATDARALSLARARADAIVTSGRILREEPTLTHATHGPEAERAGLAAWRRERLGRASPARSVVLSSGRDLDPAHPLFRAAVDPVVFTGEEGARNLKGGGVGVVGHPEPSLRAAIDWLQDQGLRNVSIEVGPTTALGLYREPFRVDELMLSIFEERDLAPPVRGAPFLDPTDLEAHLRRAAPPAAVREPSGLWRFERHVRPVVPSAP